MNVHGIRVSPYNLPSAAQYEDLVDSLRALVATVDDTRGVPQHNIHAIERFEARFFRSAQPVKEKLTSFLDKIDADYCARRPNICKSEYDVQELVRDANGEVVDLTDYTHMLELASLHPLLVTRMLILTHLNLACLLWLLAGFVSSYFGKYQTHVKFTLIGLGLGLKKQALGMGLKRILLTTLSLAFAPCKTARRIYKDEIALRRGAAREAQCLCGYRFAQTYLDSGLDLYFCLCTTAIAQLISVFYGDLEIRYQLLVVAACFFLLRPVVRKLM